jgi:anthranilate synthase component 1
MNLNREDFIKKYNEGKNFFLFETIPSDLYTPVLALKKLSKISSYHLLFESVTGGEKKARYSIIALDPDLAWTCENNVAKLSRDLNHFETVGNSKEKIFESLRKLQKESKIRKTAELPPMAAGLFGYMGYDMVRLMEKLPEKNKASINIPDSVLFRPRIVIIFDNIKDVIFIVHPIYINKNNRGDSAYKEVNERLSRVTNIIKNNDFDDEEDKKPRHKIEFKSHIEKEKYFEMVEKAKEYIRAGDIFQIVPSRRFSAPFKYPPLAFYRSLRSVNPSPYLFYMSLNGFYIIGSSPEILVKLKDDTVTIRPIAGTRKRGENEIEDKALEKDLLADQKEVAEHLMLLDLGRNDVGRCSKPGTVKVTENMSVERYSHVMHIVSNVEGKIEEGKDFLDALVAGFPAGTVSGAPKIRAMEIIEELETERRQFYAGAVGYISYNGDMDMAIALRTALIKDNKLYLQAGGGVVYDSQPEAEFQETENKAMALVRAAENAKNYV